MRSWSVLFILLTMCLASWAQERTVVYRDQQKSLINWNDMDPESWLDLELWKIRTESLAASPDWEKRVREQQLVESVGTVISCVGRCRAFRGRGHHPAGYRTKLYEGDEVETGSDSYLWLLLIDGTMVRLSPQSSLTLREINIGLNENFLQARFNHGNILWLARTPYTYKKEDLRETDSIFLPLDFFEANQPPEVRDDYGSIKNDDLLYELLVGDSGLVEHIERLNTQIKSNNDEIKFKKTTSMIVMGNATLLGENLALEAIVTPGKETLLKLRSLEQLGLIPNDVDYNFNVAKFFYRGYENIESTQLELDSWYTVDPRGRELNKAASTSLMRMGEFLTSKIHTLNLARELWLDRDFYFAQTVTNPLSLATDYGYRMWEVERDKSNRTDLSRRITWLSDYTRRIETSNIQTATLFRERLKERGESWEYVDYGPHMVNRALVNYIKKGEAPYNKEGRGPVLNSTTRLLWIKINSRK